jgi:hypothetical protein
MQAVSYYRLMEKFGAAAASLPVDRAQVMLAIMNEEADLRAKEEKRRERRNNLTNRPRG